MKIRKPLIISILLIVFILFTYWLKCQQGMNFSNSIHLSDYIPFKYLTRNYVINDPKPGELINESFDQSKWLLNNWTEPWMIEKGKVTQTYDNNGINNSRVLLIKSTSSKHWDYNHYGFVQVKPGDTFYFEGFIKIDEKDTYAYLGVASFDKNKKVIKYSYVRKKVNKRWTWIKVKKQFKIPDGIEYIRLRLTGSGIGEYRFDNIRLVKEPPIDSQGDSKE